MSAQGKKKTFRVEAFKHRVTVDPKYAESTWKILEHAIHEIYNHHASELTHEELYRRVYNMVLHKFGEELYSGLVSTMTSQIKEMAKLIEASQEALFLEELNRNWMDHNNAVKTIRDIFLYMDRTFVPSTHKTPVHQLGLNLWKDYVIHSSIQTRLKESLIGLVRRERTGEVINRGLMSNVINMLMGLGSSVYQDVFEKPFLEDSATFYRGESQQFECCDFGDYLKKVQEHLNEEIERVSHYLDAKSEAKIIKVLQEEMIENHMDILVCMDNSGLVNLLVEDKYEDLGRMYRLFVNVPNGLSRIRDFMTSYIQETCKQVVTEDPVEFKQRLFDEKDKYDKIISLAFDNDKPFQNSLNSSFEAMGAEIADGPTESTG